jgi:hypothetical protein
MKLVRWVRFNWELNKLPSFEPALPEHYQIALATAADEKDLRTVITRSFALDSDWSDAMHEVSGMLEGWFEIAFRPEAKSVFLALRHGVRTIGAAIVIPDAEAEYQLAPGPCILSEYRNRAFGSALLAQSLRELQNAGLTHARTIARENTPAAKFLFSKFESTVTPSDVAPLIAA